MPIITPDDEFREGFSHNSRQGHSPGPPRDHGNPDHRQPQRPGRDREAQVQIHPIAEDKPVDQLESHELDEVFDYRDLFLEDLRKDDDGTNGTITMNNKRYLTDEPTAPLSSSVTHIRVFDMDIDIEDISDETQGNGNSDNVNSISKQNCHRNPIKSVDEVQHFWGLMPCRQYKVGLNLKNEWIVQANFFSKIMLVKTIQLAIISIWMFIIGRSPGLEKFVSLHSDWAYLPLSVVFVIIIVVRLIARSKSNWHPLVIVLMLSILTGCMAYALGAVSYKYKVHAISVTVWILLFTFLIITFTPYISQVPITETVISKTGGILVLVVSIMIFVISIYTQNDADVTDFAKYVWFPAMIAAEAITWVTIGEIQHIILGWSFHVSERRWFFSTLYV